jgi:hypothetical protein
MIDQLSAVDSAARASRRQLLVVLVLLLVLSAAALLQLALPGLAASGHALWKLMPGVITTVVVVLYGIGKHIDKRSMNAVRNDELRKVSLQRAWRNGFFVMLGAQPITAVVFIGISISHETAAMAAVNVLAGSLTVLASLLWYDR